MKSIKNKLKNSTGASITFALLLFLICAVLCAIVLFAASTAARHMGSVVESDQRYYSVTSAAELVAELLDDKTVSVLTASGFSENGSKVYSFSKPMNEVTDEDLITNTDLTTEGGADHTIETHSPDFAEQLALFYASDDSEKMFDLTTDITNYPLPVTIKAVAVREDDTLNIYVSNADSDKKKYEIKMVFSVESKSKNPAVSDLQLEPENTARVISERSGEYSFHLTHVIA